MSWSVYIVRCKDGSLYTGISTDVAHRIERHNAGEGAKYTRSRLPVRLVFCEEMDSESAARKREMELKRWKKSRKESFVYSSATLPPIPGKSGRKT